MHSHNSQFTVKTLKYATPLSMVYFDTLINCFSNADPIDRKFKLENMNRCAFELTIARLDIIVPHYMINNLLDVAWQLTTTQNNKNNHKIQFVFRLFWLFIFTAHTKIQLELTNHFRCISFNKIDEAIFILISNKNKKFFGFHCILKVFLCCMVYIRFRGIFKMHIRFQVNAKWFAVAYQVLTYWKQIFWFLLHCLITNHY